MEKNFEWKHIEFVGGGNPYICKTEKEFKKMQQKYELVQITDYLYKATDRITYDVIGFTDKTKMATFHKEYGTKESAMRVIRKALKEKKFELITLRKNVSSLFNSDTLEISSSGIIATFE